MAPSNPAPDPARIDSAPGASPPNRKERVHLRYLDGIRGLAALYVVFFHATGMAQKGFDASLPHWARLLRGAASQGHYAVVVFIVLSGYCLGLPVVSSPERWFRGGTGIFFRRRAWRILPPYYAALALDLWIQRVLPSRNQLLAFSPNVVWADFVNGWGGGSLLSHLLLLQNLKLAWWSSINWPTWTVATEWQLYFTLPLWVYLWRRQGMTVASLAATAAGVILGKALPGSWIACPWFSGCFVFGLAAAAASFGPNATKTSRAVPAGLLPAALLLSLVVLVRGGIPLVTKFVHHGDLSAGNDLILGATTAAVLAFVTGELHAGRKPWLARFTASRPLAALGAISYSLYLIHSPILMTVQLWTRLAHLDAAATQVAVVGCGTGLSLLTAIVFYWGVERPSMRVRG